MYQTNELIQIARVKRLTKFGNINCSTFSYGEYEIIQVYWLRNNTNTPLLRIQLGCLDGIMLGLRDCDCGLQFEESLKQIINNHNGLIIYLPTFEGKGKGLINKMKLADLIEHSKLPPYATAQKFEIEIESSHNFSFVKEILNNLHFSENVILLSNNSHKAKELKKYGLNILETKKIAIDKTLLSDKAISEIEEKEDIEFAHNSH